MRDVSRRDFLRRFSSLPLAWLLGKRPRLTHSSSGQIRPVENAPNILVIVFDALSARDMSLYGYRRKTTPNLDRLARAATVYYRHYSTGSYTPPATASILTGTLPWTHRAFHHAGTVIPEVVGRNVFRLMSRRGYHTIAYTQNPFADVFLDQFREDLESYEEPWRYYLFDWKLADRALPRREHLASHLYDYLRRGTWFVGPLIIRGSAASLQVYNTEYKDRYPDGVPNGLYTAYLLEDAIDGTLHSLMRIEQPFFAYFHYYPPHHPYTPPGSFVGRFRDGWMPAEKPAHFSSNGYCGEDHHRLRREYDEHIAYVDAEFARLYGTLERAGLLDRTYVFVTSDHGELFERGLWGHENPTLYDPLLHVPLIVLEPGQSEGREIHQPTSCVDLLPTWLHLAGAPIPDWAEGEIASGFRGSSTAGDRHLFALDAKSNHKRAALTQATSAIITRKHKLIHSFGYEECKNGYELYDLENDPDELVNLYASHPSIARELSRELQEQLDQANQRYAT
jgi:arylsulfatase A-like enzyme